MPTGQTATWAVSPDHLFPVNGRNGTRTTAPIRTATASTSGSATLTFTVTTCGTYQINKQISVGEPSATTAIVPNYQPICTGEYTYFDAFYDMLGTNPPGNKEADITNYIWTPLSGVSCFTAGTKNEVLACWFDAGHAGFPQTVAVHAVNSCGQEALSYANFTPSSGFLSRANQLFLSCGTSQKRQKDPDYFSNFTLLLSQRQLIQMDKEFPKPEIIEKIKQLEEKFRASGQDLSSYLEGLLHADYLNYWDYIHLDTLLTLQQPRTSFKDEKIFIIYHQITELYFHLIIWEIEQIAAKKELPLNFFKERLKRVIMYFDVLVSSFSVMAKGMEREQFMKFRMSLLPSSGFQSAQYRMIEIMCTDIQNLVHLKEREDYRDINLTNIDSLFDILYWQYGATELASGEKTLTLKSFEKKYGVQLKELIADFQKRNLWKKFLYFPEKDDELTSLMRELDVKANVYWPLAHYKSAVRYLQKDPVDIAATGGTNWQKYLPPRFQKVVFYPELWSEEEIANWGKSWVVEEVFSH